MQLELLNEQGQAASTIDAPETVFGRAYNEDLIHQLVTAYRANGRQGTRAQKDREQVRHTTAKPFKQKGTGRARAGMSSSPLWRGGGRVFPNLPEENFTQKINKKMYRAGMASILSQLAREGRQDEANLHKVKLNIVAVYETLIGADERASADWEAFCARYESRFVTLPAQWQAHLDTAKAHGDVATQTIEEAKMETAARLSGAFRSLKG